MTYYFRLKCCYRGEADYELAGNRLSIQERAESYQQAGYNGTEAEYQRDVIGRLGILWQHGSIETPVDAETVEAFNAWRQAEHEKHKAQILAHPEKYEITDPNHEYFKPPIKAVRGFYQVGTGWIKTDEQTAIAA